MNLFPVRLSIRTKIIALIGFVLVVSFGFYLSIGTKLIVEDKTTYIYDYYAQHIASMTDALERKIKTALRLGQWLAENSDAPSKKIFQLTPDLGVQAIYLFTRAPEQSSIAQWKEVESFGIGKETPVISYLPNFEKKGSQGFQIIPISGEKLGVSFQVDTPQKSDQRSIFAVIEAGFNLDARDEAALYILENSKTLFKSQNAHRVRLSDSDLKSLDQILAEPTSLSEGSGVREWHRGKDSFLISYRRFVMGRLLAISVVDRNTAFLAAKTLVLRSLLLGIAIFLGGAGLTLLLIRSITQKLKQLALATEKVSAGKFSVRVNSQSLGRDELSQLATSFNHMAGKIEELMEATAQKARMESELKTAHAFQDSFFPNEPFDNGKIQVAGKYIPASECAGDWWQYVVVNDHLIACMGDVTGHGASAALITAVAHGTFHEALRNWRNETAEDFISGLIESLDLAIANSSGGKFLMTFFIVVFDLQTAKGAYANAGHPSPFLYTQSSSGVPIKKAIADGKIVPLGMKKSVPKVYPYLELKPGDSLFVYSDGLWDSRLRDGLHMKKNTILQEILNASVELGTGSGARELLSYTSSIAERFFKEDHFDNRDDITMLFVHLNR